MACRETNRRAGRAGLMAACVMTISSGGAVAGPAPRAAPAANSQRPAPAKPMNVLFILVDDLRPDLGAYGNRHAKTPNMDALARSGMVFERAYTQQAVCGPSRAALMTSLRPDTSGITDLESPVSKTVPNAVTMFDLFKRAGYDTLGYGKVYHHRDDDPQGWTKRTTDAEFATRQADRKAGKPRLAAERAPDRDALADTVNVKMALADMAAYAKSGKPFFMAVGLHKPHLPFVAPKENWDRFKPAAIPAPINPEGQKGAPPYALTAFEIWNYEDTKAFQPSMPADKTRELNWAYLAATSYADDLVGDLTRHLAATGLDKNTIVVLWGDHGWKVGDHGKWAKHSNAELDIHIPLVMRVPGVTRPGARTRALVETVDVYPTLAQLAGLQPPENVEGLAMTPLLRNPQIAWKSAAFAQFGRAGGVTKMGPLDGHTVRTARYRYTVWEKKGTHDVVAEELYDLDRDPAETTNVAAQAAYAAGLKQSRDIYAGGWRKVRDAVAAR